MKKLIVFLLSGLLCLSALAQGNKYKGTFIGDGGSLTNVNAINLTGTTNGITYVAKWGNNANDGSIYKPFLTISNALQHAPQGSTVYVSKGNWVECDIPAWSGTINIEPGCTFSVDMDNAFYGVFFSDLSSTANDTVTNVTLNILGKGSVFNDPNGGMFVYLQGGSSKAYIEMDEIRSPPETGGNVLYFDPHSYVGDPSYVAPPYYNQFTVRAKVIEGKLWVGECAADIEASIMFTNTYFFCDRDTTNYCPPIIFSSPVARNCQVVCQRPYASQAVFNITLWYGGPIAQAANNGGNVHTLVSCLFGNCTFNNTTFIPWTVNAQGAMFYLSSANSGYAIVDTNHCGHLTLNNCSVMFPSGNTNQLFICKLDPATATTATNRIQINGTFNSCFGAYSNSVVIDGGAVINTNALWLQQFYFYAP